RHEARGAGLSKLTPKGTGPRRTEKPTPGQTGTIVDWSLRLKPTTNTSQPALPPAGLRVPPPPATNTGGTGNPGLDQTISTLTVNGPTGWTPGARLTLTVNHPRPSHLKITQVSPQGPAVRRPHGP